MLFSARHVESHKMLHHLLHIDESGRVARGLSLRLRPVVPRVAFDVTQMQETQAKPPSLAGIDQTDEQISDLFILGTQLGAIAITGLADPESPAGQRNARPTSRHRFLGHLAASLMGWSAPHPSVNIAASQIKKERKDANQTNS